MIENTPDLLPDSFINDSSFIRKKLLPLWIKIFAWFFLVVGLLLPVILVSGIIMHSFQASIYGLESNTIYSFTAVLIILVYMFKGITAFGLLKQKDWAIKFGIIDAVTGICICAGVMLYQISQDIKFNFSLELVLLIPYLLNLQKIKYDWEHAETLD